MLAPEVRGWVWIWMGDAEDADEADIEDFHWLDDPDWRAAGCRIPMECDYRLGIDNLLDLTHLPYVHATTLGNAAVAEQAEVRTERHGAGVRVTRWMIDVPAPPMYRRLVDFGTNIDRWQIIDFSPPCFVKLDLGGAPTGTGARQGDRSKGFERKSLNALTPETGTTIHYFWADAHNFDIDKPEVTQLLFEQVHEAFMEDKAFLEAQQRAFDRDRGRPLVDINADAGGLEARRILDRLLAEQDRHTSRQASAV